MCGARFSSSTGCSRWRHETSIPKRLPSPLSKLQHFRRESIRNWASYERALIGRGNITIWLSRAAIAVWKPEGPRTRGAPPTYSDLAIETALTLRLLFHLPLRQAEGFLTSLCHLMGLDLRSPDHTTLSRRGQHLNLTRRRVPRRAALHLFIDSTGLSMVGEGEWAAATHGRRGRRGCRRSAPGESCQA